MTPIQVFMPAGEAREAKMRAAIEADKQGRFAWGGHSSDLPGDVRFSLKCDSIREENFGPMYEYGEYMGDLIKTFPEEITKTLDVEIKDFTGEGNSDYLASILNGHLWDQVTKAKGPYVVAVLGDDNDVGAAIRKAASRNHRMDPKKLMQYYEMVEGFEANCIACGVQVWRLKTDPMKRLLLRARKILEGGNLNGFAPKPMPGERQAVALSILAGDGIGPAKAKNILQKFDLCLMVKDGLMAELEDCDGIGPKLAKRIRENIEVVD
jgi:hypothetical protein